MRTDLVRPLKGVMLGAAVLVLSSSFAAAQGTTLRYTTGAPKGTPWVMQAERFQKNVGEESKGALKIDLFIAAQLGNEQDTIQQVQRGRIDMGGFSSVAASLLVPEFGLFNIPFYYDSIAQQDCIFDNLSGEVGKRLEAKGVKFLGWTEVGTSELIGKKAYMTPGEVRGIKAAANPHKISAVTWSTLGANANALGITEIVSAFQTGLVDAQFQATTFYVASGLNKFAPVMTRLTVGDTPGLTLMNKETYDKLPQDQKDALKRAADKAPAKQLRAEIRGFEDVLLKKHVADGGQIVPASAEQRDAWRKAISAGWPEMVKSVDPTGAFFAKIEAEKAKCAK
jgi:TRAP-type C4-dicarboxylate transport system substrate-binding protein